MTLTPFDIEACAVLLGPDAHVFQLHALPECDSTNTYLMRLAESGAPSGTVVVTDHQTAGRGRRARAWVSAAGDSLTFSLLWRFPPASRAPEALSLVLGLALRQAVQTFGLTVEVKWPNDVLFNSKKLAGVLIEVQPGDIKSAVIGIGVNLRLPPTMPADIAETASALDQIMQLTPSREVLLAAILRQVVSVLWRYENAGFDGLRAAWQAAQAFRDREVRVINDTQLITGICRGVSDRGELLIETSAGLQRVLAGDVSLRPA